jgi:hypothetical protein
MWLRKRPRDFFDSGIRCGADIAKALALGGKMCLVGRPCMTAAGPIFARFHKVLISNVVERVERLLSQIKLGLIAIFEDYYLTGEPVESLLKAWDLAKQYQTGHR